MDGKDLVRRCMLGDMSDRLKLMRLSGDIRRRVLVDDVVCIYEDCNDIAAFKTVELDTVQPIVKLDLNETCYDFLLYTNKIMRRLCKEYKTDNIQLAKEYGFRVIDEKYSIFLAPNSKGVLYDAEEDSFYSLKDIGISDILRYESCVEHLLLSFIDDFVCTAMESITVCKVDVECGHLTSYYIHNFEDYMNIEYCCYGQCYTVACLSDIMTQTDRMHWYRLLSLPTLGAIFNVNFDKYIESMKQVLINI